MEQACFEKLKFPKIVINVLAFYGIGLCRVPRSLFLDTTTEIKFGGE